VVALLFSSIIGILGVLAVVWYGTNRRAPGAPLTWGQANAAAAFVFFFMFWWYGIIPHQWLSWADNELNWRPDRTVWGIGNFMRPQAEGGWLPLTINWTHIRDLVAVAIYGVGLGLQIWLWAWWNNRSKAAEAKAAVVPTSSYGRPLVKKG
jgi:hypothetical protein